MVKRISSKQNDVPGLSLIQIDLAARLQSHTGDGAQKNQTGVEDPHSGSSYPQEEGEVRATRHVVNRSA